MSGCRCSFVHRAPHAFWGRRTLSLVLSRKLLVKRGRVWISGRNAFSIRPARRSLRWHRRIEADSRTITVNPLNQAGQHATNFVQRGVERLVLLFREQTKITRQQKKIIEFTGRSRRNIEKLTKLHLAATTATLRDVCRDRSRSSPHLAGNAIPLGVWEGARRHVNAQDERMALLPDPKLLKVLHRAPRTSNSSVYLQLITNNCQLTPGSPC